MSFPYGESVTVQRAGVRIDPYSNEVTTDWDNPTTFVIKGCVIFPANSMQNREPVDRDKTPVITGFTVLAPIGSDITCRDRVSFRNGPFREVISEPFEWRHPLTNWSPGMGFELESEV